MSGARPSAKPALPALPADVVVFGEALVDMFPEKPGLALEEAERFVRHIGGAPANLAVGLARQGVQAALCTLVGNDAFGRFLLRGLQDEGVVVDAIDKHKSARTGLTFVSVAPDGGRGFLFYRHPSADMMISAAHVEANPQHIRRGRIFHFGSSTLTAEPARAATLRAVDLAKASRPQVLLSCDVNLRPHLWPEVKEAPPLLRKLLFDCDIVKLVPEELPLLFGTESPEDAAAQLRKKGVSVVAVTLGERGAYLDCPAGQSYFAAESVRVVDTTGAGDAFTAGLLSGLLAHLGRRDPDGPLAAGATDLRAQLQKLELSVYKRVLLHANHLGALCCTALGATTAVPRKPRDRT